MAGQRVLISGGSGLIGGALAADLAGAGYEVVVLSRSPERLRGLPARVRAARWDGRTAAGWAALADGARAIVNLAGESIAGGRWTESRKKRIRDSRIEAGAAVTAAIALASIKPKVLVQASAVGYYGPRGEEELFEATPPGDDFLASTCVAWERSTAEVESVGVRRAVVRTGIVLSTSGGALPKLLLPYRLFVGGSFGSGRQYFPWVHLVDEIAAIRFLLESDAASGSFNLAAPLPLRNREFGRILGRVLGRPSALPAPAWALRLLLGEMSTALLDGQRAVPGRLIAAGYRFRFPEAEPALRDLLA